MSFLIRPCAGLRRKKKAPRPLKILLIGDPACGKTKLVKRYTTKEYVDEVENDLAGVYNYTREGARTQTPVVIYDTPAGRGERNTNSNMYSNADAIILCFDVCNKSSLLSIEETWIPELKTANCAPEYLFMLVGLKKDEREKQAIHNSRRGREGTIVKYKEGFSKHELIKSNVYLECSAKTGEGVKSVFDTASLLAQRRRENETTWFVKFDSWNSSTGS